FEGQVNLPGTAPVTKALAFNLRCANYSIIEQFNSSIFLIHSFTHPLIHSSTHSLIHSSTHSLIPPHSLLKLFVGFANAACSDWVLTASKAISSTSTPGTANIHHVMFTL